MADPAREMNARTMRVGFMKVRAMQSGCALEAEKREILRAACGVSCSGCEQMPDESAVRFSGCADACILR